MTTVTTTQPLSAAAMNLYQPGPDARDHNGDPVIPGRVFFAAPPPEIGDVLTARSTLKPTDRPWTLGGRLGLAVGIAAPFALLGFLLAGTDSRYSPDVFFLAIAVLVVFAFVIVYASTGFTRACSYVGELGVARYRLKGSLANPTAEVFGFPTAFELRAGQTRHYYNGVYTGTSYDYTWSDPAGKRVFRLYGQYRSKDGSPKQPDAFWFARAAEVAWNNYQLQWVARQVEEVGYAQFNLTGGNHVRVGPGFFEFKMKGEVARIAVEEIKTLSLNDGTFHIQHKDAKWFGSKGKYQFAYSSMANAQLFLIAMEKLTGYQFGE